MSARHPAIKLRGMTFVAVGCHADALRMALAGIAGNIEDALLDLETAIDDGTEPIEIGRAQIDGSDFASRPSSEA